MTELKKCPFCGAVGKMIHPMGEWISKEAGYGPDGSRIVCTHQKCCAMTPTFYGPDQDQQATDYWNTRAEVVS